MGNIEELEKYIKQQVSERRFTHTLGVVETAKELAIIYGINPNKAIIAALFHDLAKEFSTAKKREFCQEHNICIDEYFKRNIHLTHGMIAAYIAKEDYCIQDTDILNAIANHTLGSENMSELEKVIYVADMIEPNRPSYPGLEELRSLAYINLDQAMEFALNSNIIYLNAKNKEVHPIVYSILEKYNKAHMEEINERT